ncbi:class IV lanthionine synthetase LanL [Actinomadura barringtoniae]|uniref:Class IV lanthionine synthetase LanL n=1 Tax=Actinomadura barringtoniae TaxID=1427535 RepID=A0A939T4F6_9ACTN|nr:class IV lanthionine synthetase LanL [Actinomadura barringtoniae]MBO2445852.1 class IV lanthionine synthetase LanL [Actinomadura barringtoniae]
MEPSVVERLSTIVDKSGRELRSDDTWISVHDPAFDTPRQGWKLHVSARPGTLGETLDRVLPLLFSATCDFKVARSCEMLRELNSGDLDAGAVGKAITVYPPQDAVTELGHALAEALTGLAAPRVVSDRRVRPDAPVYYRYAPFAPQYKVDDNGDFELVVVGPDGETEPGTAGVEFTCPPWATDPFRPAAVDAPATAAPVQSQTAGRRIGGRYRVTTGVMRGPRGNVYRAEDKNGRAVVVKEARAYVGEHPEGYDLRMYLRNELRILTALAGVEGVPRALDHFRHGEDEFLAMTDAGTTDLNRHVAENGALGGRELADLAARLLAVLDAVHERGVVVRDLSPKNVVLSEGGDGRCTIIDFGTSRYEDLQMPGWSRGYSVPDQRTGRDSLPADDHFSLGATLYFAATGLNPVIIDSDADRAVERSLQCLARMSPGDGVVALVPRLMSLDPDVRTAAAAEIRAGRHATAAPHAPVATPKLTGDLLSAVLDHTRDECARFAEKLMNEPPDRRSSPPVTNVYAGSAGVGMELLQHPESRTIGEDLARWTAGNLPPAKLPPSLYFGLTGTNVFLTAARLEIAEPARTKGDERGDQAHGIAGIGAGHLILGDEATAAECARRLLAGDVAEPDEAVTIEQPGSGVAVDTAFAHGEAGIADFLLCFHEATGDQAAGTAAREAFTVLAKRTAALIDELNGPQARPMGASWCQGMSGIVSALLHAARAYDDAHHLDLAERGARACLAIAPRAWVSSQCCGLAGMGEALIDVALVTGDDAYWRGAEEIAELMLVRSGGETGRPVFPGNDLDTQAFTWGTGTAGILSFLRRLDRRSGPRLWTVS